MMLGSFLNIKGIFSADFVPPKQSITFGMFMAAHLYGCVSAGV
jgi:hypothetical protein